MKLKNLLKFSFLGVPLGATLLFSSQVSATALTYTLVPNQFTFTYNDLVAPPLVLSGDFVYDFSTKNVSEWNIDVAGALGNYSNVTLPTINFSSNSGKATVNPNGNGITFYLNNTAASPFPGGDSLSLISLLNSGALDTVAVIQYSLTDPGTTSGNNTNRVTSQNYFGCGAFYCNLITSLAPTPPPAPSPPPPPTSKHYTPEQKAQFLQDFQIEQKFAQIYGSLPFSPSDVLTGKSVFEIFKDAISSLGVENAKQLSNAIAVKYAANTLPNPTTLSGVLGIGALLTAVIPGAQVVSALLGAGSFGTLALGTLVSIQSYAAYYRAQDPPDSNFTVIAQPVISTIPGFPFTATDLTLQPTDNALNALLNNLLQSVSISNALQTSLNRADGAAIAGDSSWEQAQLDTANSYSLQLAALIGAQPKLFSVFANSYQSVLNQSLSLQNIIDAQNYLRTNGLSPDLIQLLTEMNISSTDQATIIQELLALDPNQLASLDNNFATSFTDPSFLSALSNESITLNKGVIGSHPVPIPSGIAGVILASITLLTFGIRKKWHSEPT